MPFVLIAGYFATFSRYESIALEYALYTGLAISACCLLLCRIKKPLQITLPFWVILAVFLIAYYIKFYWWTLFPEVAVDYLPSHIASLFFSTDALASAYATTTFAFSGFCVAAWYVIGISSRKPSSANASKGAFQRIVSIQKYRSVSSATLPITLFLMIVTTIIIYVGGFPIMGGESVSVRFRLAGIILFTRTVFLPGMILLLIWSSKQAGLHRRVKWGIAILFLYGLSDMVLRASRSPLVTLLAFIGFLFLASGYRVEKRYLFFLAGSLLITFLFLPIISEYRGVRSQNPMSDILSNLQDAQYQALGSGGSNLWQMTRKGNEFFLFRLTGVEMLIIFHGVGAQPLGVDAINILASPRGLTGFITVDIFGFPPNVITAQAPSLVGWFYLVGGNSFAVIGMIGFTLIAYSLWNLLIRLQLATLPVAQALLLSLILTLSLDGVLESVVSLQILAWPASVAVYEWLFRGVKNKG
jgi:hypothetical protein